MDSELTTATQVIKALGGPAKVAKLVGRGRRSQHVWNWGETGKLPSNTFLVLSQALERIGKTAPLELWDMTAPSNEEGVPS